MSFNKRMLSAGAADLVPSEHFKVVTYTGNSPSDNSGVTQTITGVGFQPDLVWIKRRDGAENHYIHDSSRGSTKTIYSNLTNTEYDETNSVTSFNSDGFVVGGYNGTNNKGETYVAFCWKAGGGTTSSNTDGTITTTVQANTAAGFSIFTYTGTGNNATIGHGLDDEPRFVTIKTRSHTSDWPVYHGNLGGGEYRVKLNSNDARDTTNNPWNNTDPNTTVITIKGSAGNVNAFPRTFVGYAWHSVEGFSKIGTYQGNASANGPIVNTGFEPAWLMIRRWESGDNWYIVDNVRSTSNPRQNALFANLTDGEYPTYGAKVDFLSNGFQIVSTDNATNADEAYVYMAFAADPDEEAPTLANSFNIETWAGNAVDNRAITGHGFKPGMVWYKTRNETNDHNLSDSIRGATYQVRPNRDIAQVNGTDLIKSFDTDGFTLGTGGDANASGDTYVAWSWKADDNEPTYNTNGSTNSVVSANANAGFSIVKYTGTGSVATIGHGLSSAPTFIMIKALVATANSNWAVYHSGTGAGTHGLVLSTTDAPDDNAGYFNDTAPTSTVFTVGTYSVVNESADDYIAYCFHDVTGYSKFGTYTGNGSAGKAITTGFKPDFVMIKSTVGSDNWRIYDTKRGIEKGGYLEPNRSDADDTSNAPGLTMTDTGFTITSGGVSIGDNADGNLYTYTAFAKNVASNTTLANSFNVIRYRGTGAARQVTTAGFQPDLVWTKRTSHSGSHGIFDSVRGAGMELASDSTGADQTSENTITSFDSDGFTAGSNWALNNTNYDYISWCWKAGQTWQSNVTGTIPSTVNVNTANGFSIIKYVGNGTNGATVGHGLGATPDFILIKNLDATKSWIAWNSGLSDSLGYLDNNDEFQSGRLSWGFNGTQPSSTLVTIGGASNQDHTNGDGVNYIMYCWTDKTGFSKFGTYSGSGSNSNAVSLGFKPDFVMVKRTNDSGGWLMFDSLRSTSNAINDRIEANNDQAEQTNSGDKWLTFTATTFEANGSDTELNASGSTYLYAAFKQNVTSNTTLANSFKPITYTGNGSQRSITGVGFQPDFIWMKRRNSAQEHALVNSVIGAGRSVYSDLNSAEDASSAGITSFDSDGFSVGSSGLMNNNSNTYVALCWKAGNTWQQNLDGTIDSIINANTGNGFSIVSYKGTGSAATVAHGLGAAPEVMFIKERSSSRDWGVYHKYNVGNSGNGHTERLKLNTNDANQDNAGGAYWNSTAPTSTVFSIGNEGNVNTSGKDYIAYCWAPISGYSKFGSYTGNGGTLAITGVGFKPDLVITKRTNSGSDWNMSDSARGVSQGLNPNSDAAEGNQGSNGITVFGDDGFTVVDNSGGGSGVNGSDDTYIYLAFKAN